MRLAALLAVLFIAVACDPVCGARSAANTSSSGWQLTFKGPQAGTVSTGKSDCLVSSEGHRLDFAVDGKMNGFELILVIVIYSAYQARGSYHVGTTAEGEAFVHLDVGGYLGSSASGAGTVTVNSDGRSGSVDANLPSGERVSGTWKCDKRENVAGTPV